MVSFGHAVRQHRNVVIRNRRCAWDNFNRGCLWCFAANALPGQPANVILDGPTNRWTRAESAGLSSTTCPEHSCFPPRQLNRYVAFSDSGNKMKFATISILAIFLVAGTLCVSGQTPKHRKRVTAKQPKTLVKCSHGATGGTLCAPPVTLVANPNDSNAQNTVTVQVTIDKGGNVVSARAVSGNPKLYESAVENAKRQKFAPKLLNGKLVEVAGLIVYKFENPQ